MSRRDLDIAREHPPVHRPTQPHDGEETAIQKRHRLCHLLANESNSRPNFENAVLACVMIVRSGDIGELCASDHKSWNARRSGSGRTEGTHV